MTDTEKAALCARIDELCAEVEALKRDEWSAGFNAGCEAVEAAYEDGKAHYEAENAKLRELVVTLMACVSVDDCDKCPINGAEFKVDEVRCCREAKQRMQALGIEVYG